MDLFNLISALNPAKVKTGTRPRAAHEVSLLTTTANRVIDMDTTRASGSSGTPSTVEKSPLDFADEDLPPPNTEGVRIEEQIQDELSWEIPPVGHETTTKVILETCLEEEVATMGALVNKRRKQIGRKRANDKAEVNAPPKVLRKDHMSSPAHSAYEGKSLPLMGLGAGSISSTPSAQGGPTAAKSVSDPDPLSYVKPQPYPEQDIAQSSKGTATEIPIEHVATTEVNVQLSMENACQDIVDHIAPPGYFSELCHLPNAYFLSQYNINLARQVAMGSQLRLRFGQEVKLLKKVRAKIARRDQRIQQIIGTLQEAEADMKKVTEAKNAELTKELESLQVRFSDIQVIIIGKEKVKAAFKEFKKYEDARVFANVVSAGIAKGLSKGLKYSIEHGKAVQDLVDVEAYEPEANDKLVKSLQDLNDLKYLKVDQLERLKDAPIKMPR
ncbi:hypothetical protein Tco_0837495 [Tanacetum coccineum]